MTQRCFRATALLALSLSLPLAAAEFRGLEREMSPEDRVRTGVDRLSAEQRSALDAWLQQRFAAESLAPAAPVSAPMAPTTAEPAAKADPAISAAAARAALSDVSQMGFSHYSGPREEFSARIVGSFNGWTGRTLFRLDNGQVWRQSQSDFYESTVENPEVRLRPKAMGRWSLVLKYNNRGIRVRRVE
jgi:hypothetical protein